MCTAIIFAAGRGERLRPLTDLTPKPLLEVNGAPAIEHHVKNLAAAGFKDIIINHAYLGYKIKQYLGDGSRFSVKINYLIEPPGALETGGAIINALAFIKSEFFITVNSDIYTDYNFQNLKQHFNLPGHLILAPKPSFLAQGDFGLDANNFVTNTPKLYTFAGIACYKKAIFQNYSYGRFPLAPILRSLAANKNLSGEIYKGTWYDIGVKK